MSFPTSADPRALAAHVNQSTLLGIPAELRNIIYDNVFSSETKHGLVPHALTRVSQCIRRESLAMYYASVKHNTLEIRLHSTAQFTHAKKWLAEVDTNLYPVLPDIKFSWTEHGTFSSHKVAMSCARQKTTLGEAFGKQLARCANTGARTSHILEETMRQTYEYCFGFNMLDVWVPPIPSAFDTAVCSILVEDSEDRTWIVRQLSLLPEYWWNPHISVFIDLAICKDGQEWEMSDLRQIVESLEGVVGKASQWHR